MWWHPEDSYSRYIRICLELHSKGQPQEWILCLFAIHVCAQVTVDAFYVTEGKICLRADYNLFIGELGMYIHAHLKDWQDQCYVIPSNNTLCWGSRVHYTYTGGSTADVHSSEACWSFFTLFAPSFWPSPDSPFSLPYLSYPSCSLLLSPTSPHSGGIPGDV